MSSRSKVFGAGLSGSSALKVNINGNTSGGSKKQGIPPYVGLNNWSNRNVKINANGSPEKRKLVFCMNQLSGVGVGKSQFRTANSYARKDGIRCQNDNLLLRKNKAINQLKLLLSINSDGDLISLNDVINKFAGLTTIVNIENFYNILLRNLNVGDKLSKTKILHAITYIQNFIQPNGSSNKCLSGTCPSDGSKSGKFCACVKDWLGTYWCAGICDFDSCMPLDLLYPC